MDIKSIAANIHISTPKGETPSDIKKTSNQSSNKQLDVDKTIKEANKYLKANDIDLSFEKDKDTQINIVKLIDSSTKEVLRQIPPQYIIDTAKAIAEFNKTFSTKA